MPYRRRSPDRSAPRAIVAAVLFTFAVGVLDWITGYELSVLALYLAPPGLAGWYAGRRWAVAMAVLGAGTWLGADLLAGHPYSHPGIAYWNAFPRLLIFAAFGVVAGELRVARTRSTLQLDHDGLMVPASFYRMLNQEHARLRRDGRPLTLAYVEPASRGDDDAFAREVGDALRAELRAADVVARPRGREFAVLLANTGPGAAAVALERIRAVLADAAALQGAGCTVAIGAVSCDTPGRGLNQVIQRAYQLMYQADRIPGCATLSLERMDARPLALPAR